MVMPLIEGESLQALLAREKTIPVDQAVGISAEVAAALEEAHRQGLIHRDVKPANILIEGPKRRARLMDFGIVKAAATAEETITGTGIIIGSPAYMSPEQTRGDRDIDGRADVGPAGGVLVVFAMPTFETWTASLGLGLPMWMLAFKYIAYAAAWALSPTLGWLAVEFRILKKRFNLRERDMMGSMFNLRGRYWQASPARVVLKG